MPQLHQINHKTMSEPVKPVSHRKVSTLDYFTAGLAHAGMFLLRLLPFGMASTLGGMLASTIGPRLKPSKTARHNLTAAFPDKSEAEIEAIVREVWDNMGRTVFEWPLMDKLLSGPNQNRVEVEGQDIIESCIASGKPVLFFGAHLGNWEVPPVAISALGHPVNSFYRAPNNPLLLNLFTKRKTLGELIPKGAPGAKRAFTLLKKVSISAFWWIKSSTTESRCRFLAVTP